MESNEDLYEESNDMIITDSAMRFLRETGKWGKMLAIVGFVFIGLMVLGSFFVGTLMTPFYEEAGVTFPGVLVGGLYFIMAVVYFFPVLYLYKFSTQIKPALYQKDSDLLAIAFENMKSLYKFMGIFTIVMFVLYFVFGVGALILGAAMF